ncbi:hypothetical protein [Halorussus halobius]|uniref:hypothetical protein n=1 Tax=Halorussus halobius TaxID=1710537 RepID=UPI001092DC8B|nr:hypothetical protein [Halorussus halobius]
MADAVQAAARIDHTDSAAYQDSEFNTDLDVETVQTINAQAYLDAEPTEDHLEEIEFDQVVTDEDIESMRSLEFDADDFDVDVLDDTEELESAAADCEFTADELQMLTELRSAFRQADRDEINLADEGFGQQAMICTFTVCTVHATVVVEVQVSISGV